MMKRKKLLCVLVAALLIAAVSVTLILGISGSEPPFTGEALTYYESLKQAGFPADYAERLTRLHLLYPAWEFEPLAVERSWKDTVKMETATPSLNLINARSDYQAYRHKTNSALYDSGYYQASEAAVSYFLDPRNFLNEADIFQFYKQSTRTSVRLRDLDAVIDGSFMQGEVLENGKTYAEYLIELGEEFGIDPVFLAVKLRQEQGSGTSPLISGRCGTLLATYYRDQTVIGASGKEVKPPKLGTRNETDLLALDGYYNFFNVSASGDGLFSIYERGMSYAKSHGWSTKWRALRGGAEFLRDSYIGNGQSTVYLQKFDVCAATVPHQYMQNVGGAFSEGRLIYRVLADNGLTDQPCRFRIPVYTDMPARVSADPANGDCTTYAAASDRYAYSVSLTAPITATAKDDAVFGSVQVAHNATLTLVGTLTHDYAVSEYAYAWDGGEWVTIPSENGLSLTVPPSALPAWGEHLLTVRAVHADTSGRLAAHTLCAVIHVTVVPPPEVTLTLRAGNAETVKELYVGDRYTFPTCTDADFLGYAGSNGTLYPSGYELTLTQDVTYTAVFSELSFQNGAALYVGEAAGATHLRFAATVSTKAFDLLPAGSVELTATLYRNNLGTDTEVTHIRRIEGGSPVDLLLVRTPDLTDAAALRDDFSVTLSVTLHYSDGSTRSTGAVGSARRTAVTVATAALADSTAAYSPAVRDYLRDLIS